MKKKVKSWKGKLDNLINVRNCMCGLCSISYDNGLEINMEDNFKLQVIKNLKIFNLLLYICLHICG